MVVVWLCEREKVVLRENLKVCVVVVWVCERKSSSGVWVSVLSDWVCERKAVRERIIKNGKRMNILSNKCVK